MPSADLQPAGRGRRDRREQVGFFLLLLYGFFALAAGARSLYQVIELFDEAPLAISLSVLAAAVYLVAFTQLRRRTPTAWRIAVGTSAFELAGVLVVGTLGFFWPDLFPRSTVWSRLGFGYGFVPLLLPMAGLAWLTRPATRRAFFSREPR